MGSILSPAIEAIRKIAPEPLGLFGTVVQHRMPCPSAADPGADDLDDDEAGVIAQIEAAEALLAQARELVLMRADGCLMAAQSRMNEARGWLEAA